MLQWISLSTVFVLYIFTQILRNEMCQKECNEFQLIVPGGFTQRWQPTKTVTWTTSPDFGRLVSLQTWNSSPILSGNILFWLYLFNHKWGWLSIYISLIMNCLHPGPIFFWKYKFFLLTESDLRSVIWCRYFSLRVLFLRLVLRVLS